MLITQEAINAAKIAAKEHGYVIHTDRTMRHILQAALSKMDIVDKETLDHMCEMYYDRGAELAWLDMDHD